MWESGLPAKAVCQSLHVLLHHRFRRQASSHRVLRRLYMSFFSVETLATPCLIRKFFLVI